MAKNFVGKQLKIKAGTKVSRLGKTLTRKTPSIVTILAQQPVKGGKVKVFWKSHGYRASTILA